ncbi:hypothetical protein GEMRC1_004010 [Eukaryota sp. GEM-RC1]
MCSIQEKSLSTSSHGSTPALSYLQPSLLVLINSCILQKMLKHQLKITHQVSVHHLNRMLLNLSPFFENIAYVSHRFFDSVLSSIKIFLENHTVPTKLTELNRLFHVSAFFGAELQSVSLIVDSQSSSQCLLVSSIPITELSFNFDLLKEFEFLDPTSSFFCLISNDLMLM